MKIFQPKKYKAFVDASWAEYCRTNPEWNECMDIARKALAKAFKNAKIKS